MIVGIVAAAVLPVGVGAAPITWDKAGAYEACLEGLLDTWLRAQAELVVNDDPAAAKVSDQMVAAWSAQSLAQCKTRVGTEVPASTNRFANYMARWRQHIYDLADSIRQRGGAD